MFKHSIVVSDLCVQQLVIREPHLSCQITNNLEYHHHGWRWRIEQKFGIEPKGINNALSAFLDISNLY